jgi:hypothetical protein
MSKGSRKLVGFLWAIIIAVVSFFVIYIFFPDVSTKFFGVSMKNPERIGQAVSNAADSVADAVSNAAESVAGTVSDAVNGITK